MATFLHHIQPRMQRSIVEAEERMERKMVKHTKRKIAEVHQHLDTLKLRVRARPVPLMDVSTLQAALESLRADIYMILEARVPESEAPSAEPAEDTMLAVLSPLQRFHHLILESIPRGAGEVRRMRLGQGRKSAVRWRLRGEPQLLMRRRVRLGL